MAKTETKPKNNEQKQTKPKNNDQEPKKNKNNEQKNHKQKDENKTKEGGNKKGGENKKKDGDKKKEVEYKPGMSYLYDPCPHRVWTPKPGERDKSEPKGVGSPWYEPVKKKEDKDKEEEEEKKKKQDKAQKKRQKAYEEKQRKEEEEEKKKKEEEDKKKEKEKKKQKEKEKKEKEKKKKEKEERKQQEEKRKEEKERKKQEEEENKKKGKSKEKEKPQASYMYEPCPHKVYTPGPGEKDMADPKGTGSPWYVPVKKKEDVDKEDEDNRKEDSKKRKEDYKKRKEEREKEEQRQTEERQKEEERLKKQEEARRKRRKEERENRKIDEERKEMEHEEMGCGVRESRTDITPELMWMMDFITDVDDKERERRGEALRWKKEELEEEIEAHMAKEAHTRDFRELVSTFIEAEWMSADTKLKKLERDEKRRRRMLLQDMEQLAKDMLEEGKRTRMLYQAAMAQSGGRRRKRDLEEGWGDGPSPEEDALVSQVMRQLDVLAGKVVA